MRYPLLLCPTLLLTLAATLTAAITPTRGLRDFQVIQRDKDNKGAVEIGGNTGLTGRLEFSLRPSGQVGVLLPWRSCGTCKPGEWRASLTGLPVGGPYDLHLRLLDGQGRTLDTGRVSRIMVGDLWVLAGQSNMEGCGILAGGAEKPSRLVHVFDLAHRWLVAREPLHWKFEAVDPVHSGSPSPERARRREQERRTRWRGTGLGLPFAKAMVESTGVPVGLLACAKGATSMDQWSPALRHKGGHSLYGSMMKAIAAAGGRVKGILWYQGESDAKEDRVDRFVKNFTGFVAALRKDLESPSLPFYYVQIGRYQFPINEAEWVRIRNFQCLCEKRIPEPVGMVTAIDQPLVDAIHVKTRALITIGRRLALLALGDMGLEKGLLGGPRFRSATSRGGYPQRIYLTFDGVNGALRAKGRLSGFSIRDKDGKDLGIVFDQYVDPTRPDRVVLECQVTWGFKPLPKDAFIHYGYGHDPYCNLEDAKGMALPAFGPVPLPLPKR